MLTLRLIAISFGIFCIGGTLYATFHNPHIASSTFFQKLLLNVVMIYTGIVFSLLPTFMKKGLMSSDYHNSSKYEKAKTNLFMLKIFSPFWLYLVIGCYIILGFNFKLILLILFLLYYLFSAIQTVKKEEKL